MRAIHKAVHPRNDTNRIYLSKKEGGRGHVSIEDNLDVSYEDSRTTLKRAKKDKFQQISVTSLREKKKNNKN